MTGWTRRQGLALLAGIGMAGRASAARADVDVERARRTRGVPALALGWQRAPAQVQIRIAGQLAVDQPVTPSLESRWHLGSLTKSMTATLAARAVEAGSIDWDATISDTLGPLVEGMNSTFGEVTLRHLLSHRAGLTPDLPRPAMARYSYGVLEDARAERLRFALEALSMPPMAAPGERMLYANTGYVVAGAMLEARMGAPWEALVRDWVFTPLNLLSAGFGPPDGQGDPMGHQWTTGARLMPMRADNPVAMGPAGRVHMSLPDLLRYLTAHRTQEPGFLSRESWKALHTPHFGGDYALGWIALPDGRLWHNGSNGLWYAEALIGRGGVAALAQNDGRTMAGQPSVLIKSLLA